MLHHPCNQHLHHISQFSDTKLGPWRRSHTVPSPSVVSTYLQHSRKPSAFCSSILVTCLTISYQLSEMPVSFVERVFLPIGVFGRKDTDRRRQRQHTFPLSSSSRKKDRRFAALLSTFDLQLRENLY